MTVDCKLLGKWQKSNANSCHVTTCVTFLCKICYWLVWTVLQTLINGCQFICLVRIFNDRCYKTIQQLESVKQHKNVTEWVFLYEIWGLIWHQYKDIIDQSLQKYETHTHMASFIRYKICLIIQIDIQEVKRQLCRKLKGQRFERLYLSFTTSDL